MWECLILNPEELKLRIRLNKMSLEKFRNYWKQNPQSDDTNLKRLNKLNEIERIKTKEDMKKINKLMAKRDRLVEEGK